MSIFILVYMLLFSAPNSSIEKWVIEKSSSLSIEGKSNVNTFKCDISQYLNRDTILLYRDQLQDQKPTIIKGGLTINVNLFDCHHNYITADLKKTLKADQYKNMKVNLLNLGYIKPNMSGHTVRGTVEIQLAGVTRKMEIDYAVLQNKAGLLHLAGSKKLQFSQFNLTPPNKLAGLIKVDQEIKVWFQLVLRSVS